MVILPAIVDVIFRQKMDWFYRHLYTLPFHVQKPNTLPKVTGYRLLYIIFNIVFPIWICISSYQGQRKIAFGLGLATVIINVILFVLLDL
jgi:hypothetical protein